MGYSAGFGNAPFGPGDLHAALILSNTTLLLITNAVRGHVG